MKQEWFNLFSRFHKSPSIEYLYDMTVHKDIPFNEGLLPASVSPHNRFPPNISPSGFVGGVDFGGATKITKYEHRSDRFYITGKQAAYDVQDVEEIITKNRQSKSPESATHKAVL